MFETPEYDGGVPGPTDYITLVAELRTGDQPSGTAFKDTGGSTPVAPEAARPWLAADFRTLLEKSKHSNLVLSPENACRPYAGTMTTSGRRVNGFACIRPGRSLTYPDLQSN